MDCTFTQVSMQFLVKDFGGDWSGSGNSTICIPFIDFTPQQLKEREEAELQRQKRISIIKKLRDEGVLEKRHISQSSV